MIYVSDNKWRFLIISSRTLLRYPTDTSSINTQAIRWLWVWSGVNFCDGMSFKFIIITFKFETNSQHWMMRSILFEILRLRKSILPSVIHSLDQGVIYFDITFDDDVASFSLNV